MTAPYFEAFETRLPPKFAPMSARRRRVWHFIAGVSAAAGGYYLHWRWSQSLNPDALVFSVVVAAAETLFFLGTLLFYFDIWEEGDTPVAPLVSKRSALGLDEAGQSIMVDVFITTYDEPVEVVRPSLKAALALQISKAVQVRICLLDDGDRAEMAELALQYDLTYFSRQDNAGFKAGNLRHALLRTEGDFVVICDADTRVFPSFLQNTLGYFSNSKVAWVQTPHWFYDLPEGQPWGKWVWRKLGQAGSPPQRGFRARALKAASRGLEWVSGRSHGGADPFLSDPTVFFDVIQRRRNRHGASFCCGAASVHRREAVFDGALLQKATQVTQIGRQLNQPPQSCLAGQPLQPYRYHVSEDLYTSILLHENRDAGWTSVYHPEVEARMLSPWSLEAWAAQRIKYAGGTFDIALRDNPLFRRGLTWQQKLHYGATFWSYLSLLWAPILLLAPMLSLVSGMTPVQAYSGEFFRHFLPAVVIGELAMLAACKGHAIGVGRVLAVATIPLHLRALVACLRGKRAQFAPTPKLPTAGQRLRHVWPHFALLAGMSLAGGIGIWRTLAGTPGFGMSLLGVNLFWLGVNMILVGRIASAVFWRGLPQARPDRSDAVNESRQIGASHVSHPY